MESTGSVQGMSKERAVSKVILEVMKYPKKYMFTVNLSIAFNTWFSTIISSVLISYRASNSAVEQVFIAPVIAGVL